MTQNKASFQSVEKGGLLVRVNEQNIFQFGDEARAKKMVERLNRIFEDPERDLDFITPSVIRHDQRDEEVTYTIICPLVRRHGGSTYFHPMSKRKPLDRDLYPEVEWNEGTDAKKQTAILELNRSDSPAPWVLGTMITNRIRRAITLPFPDASGRRQHPTRCYQLNLPHNQSDHVETVIAEKTFCAVYAHPCQGRGTGTHSPKCKPLGYGPENIINPFTCYCKDPDEFEILHGQDITCAMTPSNGWYDKYKNHFIRVTNLKSGLSVVVRVTDRAPKNRGVELTYGAWTAIGKPLGYDTVKVELLGN